MLTIRPGTTMTFFGALPPSAATILASARAAASTTSSGASAATMMRDAHLAVDLHRQLDRVVDQQRRVGDGERLVGERSVVAEQPPQLLGQVRGERGAHQHQLVGDRPRAAAQLGEVVVQLDQLGDRGVEPQRLHVGRARRRSCGAAGARCRRRSPAGRRGACRCPRRPGCATGAAGSGTCRRRRGSPTGAMRPADPWPSRTGAACRRRRRRRCRRARRRSSGSCPSCPTRG